MPAQSHITLRELRDLLAVQPPPIDIPPSDARPGDLVAIKDLAGSRFVSIQDGVLVVRADLNAEVRKPVPIKSDSVVAIRHRIAEGDFVIVESLATPRLGRIERIEQTGPNGPAYVVRTFLEGRRWADARMRFGADSLWPVPTEAASGLLAKMGLPLPPALPITRHVAAAPGRAVASAAAPSPEPQPALPPMPPGELTDVFARVAFPGPLRRYQSMALDAFDKARASGRRRAYLVMPPRSRQNADRPRDRPQAGQPLPRARSEHRHPGAVVEAMACVRAGRRQRRRQPRSCGPDHRAHVPGDLRPRLAQSGARTADRRMAGDRRRRAPCCRRRQSAPSRGSGAPSQPRQDADRGLGRP